MTLFLAVFATAVCSSVGYVMYRVQTNDREYHPVHLVVRSPRIYPNPAPTLDPEVARRMGELFRKMGQEIQAMRPAVRAATAEIARAAEAMRSPYPPADDQKGKPK